MTREETKGLLVLILVVVAMGIAGWIENREPLIRDRGPAEDLTSPQYLVSGPQIVARGEALAERERRR